MDKKFFVTWSAITILSMILGFIVHGLLLADDYTALVPNLFRSPEDAQQHFHFMILSNICIGFALTWIYRKGVEQGKPAIGQGIRFGLAVALLTTIPKFLVYYVVQPIPGITAMKQIIFDTIAVVILGIATAALNARKES